MNRWGGSAALYECRIRHVRVTPLRHSFTYRTYLWYVDLDALPRLPLPLRPWASFRSSDHLAGNPALGSEQPSIRSYVDAFLATHGIDLTGGHIHMLSQARMLGHLFNPLTLYWCRDSSAELVCVIAEVHNTYGQRHAYLLRPDSTGSATTAKEFYVSPFFAVSGAYRMRVPEPHDQLRVTIGLHGPDGARPFVATLTGRRRPVTVAALVRCLLRHPLSTVATSLRIRRQGVALLLRGLPVQPRPSHHRQEGVS